MILVDSHCHLNMDILQQNLKQLVDDAAKNNVKVMQTVCTKIDDVPFLESIVSSYPNIFMSVGVHPNEVDISDVPSTAQLLSLAEKPKVIGLGETGLDYYHNNFQKNKQIESFLNHIECSRLTSLPLIIHCRDSEEDLIEILTSEMKKSPFTGVIHCFTGSDKLASCATDLGLYISLAGIITFKNANQLRETVKRISLDRILIETDSPYLAPVPMRGKVNQPAFVLHVAQFMADLFDLSLEDVANHTTSNFFKLFSKCDILK